MKPHFEHDCNECEYLGSTTFPAPHYDRDNDKSWTVQTQADLYCCGERDILGPTVIARFSSEGSDYSSCPASILRASYLKMSEFSTSSPALIAAYYFACAKGLLQNE